MTPGKKRSGTADRVAQVLREEIAKGKLTPGMRLSEEALGASLGVARNTLREAFRILSQERLVEHVLNRGVFVRELTVEDIADVYRLRRAIEIEAISPAEGELEELDLGPLRAALERADAATLAKDWAGVGTADLEFHTSLVALAGSERLTQVMSRLLAELRLAFRMAANVDELHASYVLRNKMLLALLEEGDLRGAVAALRTYLADSESDILKAYAQDRATG
jgi:DNA-binding GntR family transcriptional regulator